MRVWCVRAAVIAALVAAHGACAPSSAALDRTYEDAQQRLRRGRVDEALAEAQQGASRADASSDALRAWQFRLLAADAHLTKLEFPAAMAVLEQPVPEGPGFDLVRGRQLLLLARAKVAQGDLAAAQPLVDQAKPLAAGDARLGLDLDLLESQLLYRSGKAPAADALLEAARARATSEGDSYRLAQVSNNIGLGLVTRGRFDEALPFFESVLDQPEVEGTSVQGAAFNNAGLCHARLGQFERAVALQQKAIRIQEQGRKRDYAQALGELGATYLLQEDFARGADSLQQAFGIAAGAGLTSDAALFARNLAAAFVGMGRWDEAARFNAEASRFGSQGGAPGSPYATVTAAQVAAGRGQREEAIRLFTTALHAADATPGVRWMSYDGLARVARAEGKTAEATRHFEAAVKTVEQTRSALLRADYRISFTSRLKQFYRGYVDLLLSEGQVERALEVADSSRGRVLAERQGVAAPTRRASAAELKRLARHAKATLVFYWLGADASWVWTVTEKGIVATALPGAAAIESLVTEHQAAIQNAVADPLTMRAGAGDRLYDAVVKPIASGLSHGGTVVIVPDGALHRLNFETLPVPDAADGGRETEEGKRQTADGRQQTEAANGRHYWIDDVTVQIAPSLSMLQAASHEGGPERARAASSLLLIGNATPRLPEFPALSYAPAEMSNITRHFPPGAVSVFDGERASPASFKAAEPGRFSVIHFTSHAVANTESPLDSAVILSGPDPGYKLYAREVAALPLTADLVTVSACRSAGERAYAGEGLVGFAWAFLRAGSRRVVAGLWDVDDRSTATLMDQVYERIAAGAPPATALREAKRALMRAGYPNPYYWAPFQMFTLVL